MAVGREVLTQIRSVQSTQKITRAMQMVSTSKMRKTQERMRTARPYADKIRTVMAHLAQANDELEHPLLAVREDIKRAGILLITSDKGLCGGLNINSLKVFYTKVQELTEKGIEVDVCCVGSKGLMAAKRTKMNVISSVTHMGDTPQMEKLIGPLTTLFEKYAVGELDEIHVIYASFVSTMKQAAICQTLLPIDISQATKKETHAWDYVYEPDATAIMSFLVRRYLESVVLQALSDNMASEQAARMIAMKSATDNAGDAIKRMRLIYNKSRQAAITTELSEIVAGAAAV